jgi:hypothetical protein
LCLHSNLFHKGLFPLRDDFAILTFNYDPYLPYLLSKAYETRCKALGKQGEANAVNAITSGFRARLVGPLEQGDDLCVLQLHGSIAWPTTSESEDTIWYYHLFGTDLQERVQKLCFSNARRTCPPIIFPWEVFDDKSQIINEREFCLKHDCDTAGEQSGYVGIRLHQIFEAIWKRRGGKSIRQRQFPLWGFQCMSFLTQPLNFYLRSVKPTRSLYARTGITRNFRGTEQNRTALNGNMHEPLEPDFQNEAAAKGNLSRTQGREQHGNNDLVGSGANCQNPRKFRGFYFEGNGLKAMQVEQLIRTNRTGKLRVRAR